MLQIENPPNHLLSSPFLQKKSNALLQMAENGHNARFSDIHQTFKLSGLSVDLNATKELTAVLGNEDDESKGTVLKRVVEAVLKMDLNSTIVTHKIMCDAIQIVQKDMYSCRGDILKIYDAQSIPLFKYDPKNNKFVRASSMSTVDEDRVDDGRPEMFIQRLLLIRKRMSRHTIFNTSSNQWSNPPDLQLVKTEAILSGGTVGGSRGNQQRLIVIGSLINMGEGKLSIEDETGVLPISGFAHADVHLGFYCENTFVVVEGKYINNEFKLSAIGLPPPEPIQMTRRNCACINYLSEQETVPVWANERLVQLEQETGDCMIVFMSEVRLDQPAVLEQLEIMLEKYSVEDAVPPAGLVICGDFIDPQIRSSERSDVFKDAMNNLCDLLTKHEKMYNECKIVLIPGPNDPGPPTDIFPRFPNTTITSSTFKQKDIEGCNGSELYMSSNPVWLTFCSQSMVVFRYNLAEALLTNAIHRPNREDSALDRDIVRTVLSQSHLLPLPQQLYCGPKAIVVPSLDHTLRLYPGVPDLIILADKYASFVCNDDDPGLPLVVNPGPFFTNNYSFVTYFPGRRCVEVCQIPRPVDK